MKIIFITILLITFVTTNLIIHTTFKEVKINSDIQNRILDIKNTNGLIDTYSNLFNELIPANAK
jgi:hypothetical protein